LPRELTAIRIFESARVDYDQKLIAKVCEEKNQLYQDIINDQLKPSDIFSSVKQILINAKKQDYKLICIDNSSNASLVLKKMELTDLFDFIYDPKENKNLSTEELKLVDPILKSLNTMKLSADQCIGFEDTISGINSFKEHKIFTVAIAYYQEAIKKEANYAVDLPSQLDLEQILFNYYQNENND